MLSLNLCVLRVQKSSSGVSLSACSCGAGSPFPSQKEYRQVSVRLSQSVLELELVTRLCAHDIWLVTMDAGLNSGGPHDCTASIFNRGGPSSVFEVEARVADY